MTTPISAADAGRARWSPPRRLLRMVVALAVLAAYAILPTSPLAGPAGADPDIRYVRASASGADDGTSWADAFTDLQDALEVAVAGDEIWVAEGLYKPAISNRLFSFRLIEGVALYGGFVGNETERGQRDPSIYSSVLSGDLAGDDDNSTIGPDEPTRDDNSFHVVAAYDVNASAVLDGFVVTGGNANEGDLLNPEAGGGMYNNAAWPLVRNVLFLYNTARSGGAMYNRASFTVIKDVRFFFNVADDHGGGVYNSTGSFPVLTKAIFWDNTADRGGGMSSYYSPPVLRNVTFYENHAETGGAMENIGSSPLLTNVTMMANTASNHGAGIANVVDSSPDLRNTIVWGNVAPEYPSVWNASGTPTFDHSLIEGSGGSGSWDSYFGSDLGGNLDVDPLMAEYGVPLAGSPAFNAGDNGLVPPDLTTDVFGSPRIQAGLVDMGAVEYSPPVVDSEPLVIDGDDHLAALYSNRWTGETRVEVRDVAAGNVVSDVPFGSSFVGTDLEIRPGGAAPDLVVLGTNAGGAVRATVKDSVTGALIGRANYGSAYSGDDLEVVGSDLAVLGTHLSNRNVRVKTRTAADVEVGTAYFGDAYTATDLELFGDIAGVLGTKHANGNVRVRFMHTDSGAWASTAYFGNTLSALDLEIDGFDVVVLQQRHTDDVVRAQTRTPTGTKVATANFGLTPYMPTALEIVNGDPAVMGISAVNQAVRVQTRSPGGSLVGTSQFGTAYSGIDLEVIDGDIAVLGEKTNGRLRNQIRTIGGTLVTTIYYG